MRSTKLRHAITETLTVQQKPLTVPALQHLLVRRKLMPHKTSLYRSLEKMRADGIVQRVILDASGLYYELQKNHHHHALCTACRAVMCVADDLAEQGVTRLEKAAAKSGFAITEHHIALKGLCAVCQKR